MGQSPASESYNNFKQGIPLLNGPTEFTRLFPIATQWTTDPKKYASTGDILLTVRGSSTGKMNISDGQYAIGRGLASIKSRESNQEFMIQLLKKLIKQILVDTTGSTFANISKDNLTEIATFIPVSLKEKKVIGNLLTSIDNLIVANERFPYPAKQNTKQY